MNTNNHERLVSRIHTNKQAARREPTPFNWVDTKGFNFKWQMGVYICDFSLWKQGRGGVSVCQSVAFPVPLPPQLARMLRLTLTNLQECRPGSASDASVTSFPGTRVKLGSTLTVRDDGEGAPTGVLG